jgi:hypothetical protein
MDIGKFPFDLIKEASFTERPRAIPANLRPVYRLCIIMLILKCNCRANTGSILQMQFFNWILKSPVLRDHVLRQGDATKVFSLGLIHLDPMVNLALRYGIAEGLIEVTNQSKFKLTDLGDRFVETIRSDDAHPLVAESGLLSQIGKRSVSDVNLRGTLL